MQFRIGLNLGEVIVDHGEVHGNGVNVAALSFAYEYLGEHTVKNIEKPVRAYRVNFTGEPSTIQNTVSAPAPKARKLWSAAAIAILALGALAHHAAAA